MQPMVFTVLKILKFCNITYIDIVTKNIKYCLGADIERGKEAEGV